MIWWLVAAIVVVITPFLYLLNEGYPEDAAWITFWTAFFAGAVAALLNLAFMNVGYSTAHRTELIGDLQNIRDGQGVHGEFFLGSGTVDSTPEYTYYIKNADGSYALRSLQSDNVRVWQDDSPPRLECRWRYLTHDHDATWSIFPPLGGQDQCDSYDFHVPPGSIVRDYTLGK